ncbi:ParB/RepB/Spo0J family partition protein [Luteipulveratus halotolerans]|uniref:ParB/RepB/Spo0J family partition protein n=1 Tax=Luteipulveratus halotolerans TaxID=1631356 RepID=UPI0006829763|nr:ParB/RepB/Spo0J family partition protein [Luteipulveratus halotolerans]
MATTTPAQTTKNRPTPSVVEIDPATVQIGANVRSDAAKTLTKDFISSVREQGVIVPVVGYYDTEGAYVVVDGQRRTLAAIEAKRPTIPAYAAQQREDADRIIAQMAANYHRASLTAADEVKGFEQLAGFGVSAAQIAKRTGAKRADVDSGLAVTKSELATKATQRYDFLTLDQAAGLAEFEDDTEAVTALTAAAQTGQFDHVLQKCRDERSDREQVAQAQALLREQGVTVLDAPPSYDDEAALSVDRLRDAEGNAISVEDHGACPGHAAYVRMGWEWVEFEDEDLDEDQEPSQERQRTTEVHHVCTDYKKHGHRDWYSTLRGSSTKKKAADMTDAERKKAAAERREVIEGNKAWRAAETVRQEWVTKFLTRKSAPKGAGRFVAATIVANAQPLSEHRAANLADVLLYGGKHEYGSTRAAALTKATDGRALVVAVGHCCAAYEARMSDRTWRSVDDDTARYLDFLAANGYPLGDIEQRAAGRKTKREPRTKRASTATGDRQAPTVPADAAS